MNQLGVNIKVARIQKRISQKDLAIKMGKSANWLCQVECGKRTPSIRLLSHIANALGVTMIDTLPRVNSWDSAINDNCH